MSCIFNDKIASCNTKKVTFAMLMLHQQSTTYNRSKPIKTTALHGLTPSSFGYVRHPDLHKENHYMYTHARRNRGNLNREDNQKTMYYLNFKN